MGIVNRVKLFSEKFKEKRFWRSPDHLTTRIDLNGDRIYGWVKQDLGLLNEIPDPETGYFYKDVVKVIGPMGVWTSRDSEEHPLFKAIKIHKKSNLLTFTFNAILPRADELYLFQEFEYNKLKARYNRQSYEDFSIWNKGYCTADKLETVERILEEFVKKRDGRQVKDIKLWCEENK